MRPVDVGVQEHICTKAICLTSREAPKVPRNEVRHFIPLNFSSRVVIGITVCTIVITAIIISFAFTNEIRSFIIEKRIETIFSLVGQQAARHIDGSSAFFLWEQEDSKKIFRDFEQEILRSFKAVRAIELHTPQGILVWTTMKWDVLGTTPEKKEVAEVLHQERITADVSPQTITELGTKDIIEIYVPIRGLDGAVSGVAEIYVSTSDIVAFTQRVQRILWGIIIMSTIMIFFLLRFAFKYRDAQILNRTTELENLTKSLEKKVRERTKQIEEEKIRDEALLASLGEGMFATDNEGKITAMNRAAEKMLGWNAKEIIRGKLVEAIPAVDNNGATVPIEKRACLMAATTGTTAGAEDNVYFVKKNGGRVPVQVTATPMVINGKVAGAVVIFRDITKYKELEETRKNLLSLASHQLRTPLSGTKWLIETLKKGLKGPLNKGQEEYLDEIYKINERMSSLVHDMMGVLRIEGNVDQTKKEYVSAASILNALVVTLNGAAESKGIILRLPEKLNYEIDTDPLMLRTILECIVSNAINYSKPRGEVVVSIQKSSTELIFTIKDSGIGIPQKEQGRLFERFYRASNAKTFDTNGTGLGLYIASMLAKKIGVLLTFESEEGVGTTFYMHVPYSTPE